MKPEKLNLWDRFFNRYREELISTYYRSFNREGYYDFYIGEYFPPCKFKIKTGVFKKIDRLTGSVTEIEKTI